jgi:hypothetical protein
MRLCIEEIVLPFAFGGCDWVAFYNRTKQAHFLVPSESMRDSCKPPLGNTFQRKLIAMRPPLHTRTFVEAVEAERWASLSLLFPYTPYNC